MITREMLLFATVFCAAGLLSTTAQPPLSLPSPDPITGTVQSTTAATGFLPDTGSNWFDRKYQSLDDNVGKPFIPGPDSPLSIYNKPEVLDPFYSKTNVFHHHHHFIIPVHKHVKHIHHHHHHNHHTQHHVHPILLNTVHRHAHHNNHQHIHSNGQIYPGTLVSALHNNAHRYKGHNFGIGLTATNTALNVGHHSNAVSPDPSIADNVAVPLAVPMQQNQITAPAFSNAATQQGSLASQTVSEFPNNHVIGTQTLNSHQLNGYTYAGNNALLTNNQNNFAVPQGAASAFNQLNGQIGSIPPAGIANSFAPQNGINGAELDTLTGTGIQPLANSFGKGLDQVHSGMDINSNGHAKLETAVNAVESAPMALDHGTLEPALTTNHATTTDIANNIASLGTNGEQLPLTHEIHHFLASSNGDDLQEFTNLPLQFFSQGHHVTSVGDHASIEANHAVVEAGFSEDHLNHHVLDSLNGHNHGESVEHVLPSTGAIHVTEDSHGHVHKHANDWNEAEHVGSHSVHVETYHNKQPPYAIHVSDNGHGYAVQADEYHDHYDGQVEHVMENDLHHVLHTEQGITNHGIIGSHDITTDNGITNHDIIDHGLTEDGVTEHSNIIDNDEIDDHGITDALNSADAVDDVDSVLHHSNYHNNHDVIDQGISDHEIIDHGISDHGINSQQGFVPQEVHDPGIHVNFHAIDQGNELNAGIDSPHNLEHGAMNEVGPVLGSHETTEVVHEHLHEAPHLQINHDDHRDYHDGGIAPELVETNIHSNIVPEYDGNNPMTDLHSAMGHGAMHDARHGIHDIPAHDTMLAGMHSTEHDGIHDLTHGKVHGTVHGTVHGGIHDAISASPHGGVHDEIHQTTSGPLSEFDVPEHIEDHAIHSVESQQAHSSTLNYGHEDPLHHSTQVQGVHGFDEHGEEFLINRGAQSNREHDLAHAQKEGETLADRSEENQVHLDEKDAELLKKAKENEIVDPPYLTHLDPHGDGFGEGVVGGPDLNVGNDIQTGPVASSFPAIIPNSPPFVGNHPATSVQGGNIVPDYGSKRQKFENTQKEPIKSGIKSGYVSTGDPKRGSGNGGNRAVNDKNNNKVVSTKAKLSKFIKDDKKESMSYFANDRETKAEQTFETVPNEPRIILKTEKNSEKQKENPKDSSKIPSTGVNKENEHNITNNVSSNEGKESEDDQSNNTKVETKGKDLEQNNDVDNQTEKNGTNSLAETENVVKNDAKQKSEDEQEGNLNIGQSEADHDKYANGNDGQNGTNVQKTAENNTTVDKDNKQGEKESSENGNDTLQDKNQTKPEVRMAGAENLTNEYQGLSANESAPDGSTSLNKTNKLEPTENTEDTNRKEGSTENKDMKESDETSKDKIHGKAKGKEITRKVTENLKQDKMEKENKERHKNAKKGIDLKTNKEQENKTNIITEKIEDPDMREYSSGSGEGSGQIDKPTNKKSNEKIFGKQEEPEGTRVIEQGKVSLKSKDTSNKTEKLNIKEGERLSQGLQTKGAKDGKSLNKSKAKGKKGEDKNEEDKKDEDRKGEDEKEEYRKEESVQGEDMGEGELGGEKATGGDAENNPGGMGKEQIQQQASSSAVEQTNMTNSWSRSLWETADNKAKVEKSMNKSSPTFFNNEGDDGGAGGVKSYASINKPSTNAGDEEEEVQKVDEEGRNAERSPNREGQLNQESNKETGFEKVGPPKNASSFIENGGIKKSDAEKVNVSVDREEWKSSGEKDPEHESTSDDKDNNNVIMGHSANGPITNENNENLNVEEPTEPPTQFFFSDDNEERGNTKTLTESTSAHTDALQVVTDNNSHESDGIIYPSRGNIIENYENIGEDDPIDIVKNNRDIIEKAQNTAGDKRGIFGERSTKKSSRTEENPTSNVVNSSAKSKIGKRRPTESLIRKRNQQLRYENRIRLKAKDIKDKKKTKRIHIPLQVTSGAKLAERKRKGGPISLSDIFRRFLSNKRIIKRKKEKRGNY